ncbi:MAG: DUF1501 domain-containing protein [Phycisphaeraceae bacterium]
MSHDRFDSSRRDFLAASAATGAAALAGGHPGLLSSAQADPQVYGKAEHCIFLWLTGGMGQIDTFDPKPKMGVPEKREPGSYYESIPTAIRGEKVCKHLPRVAERLDRFNVLRTVNHNEIDEHAAATNRMHTGRPTTGSIVYPSIGSIVAHEKGDGGDAVPRYVLIGYPSVSRGPGFLGAEANYLYLTDIESGPAGFTRPGNVSERRQEARDKMLARIRELQLNGDHADRVMADYDTTIEQTQRLASPEFMNVFDIDSERKSLRESYGSEFGERCLLARRLVQRGVRFVEVSHNLNFVNGAGWDVHRDAILKQHLLIEELDKALSTLVTDLEAHNLLEKTLIVATGEFGRPSGFDGAGGRDHYNRTFSVVMAGGGRKSGKVIGETDELAMNIESRPVPLPDLFATIVSTLGINPSKELYAADRPVPITDMGTPVSELFT